MHSLWGFYVIFLQRLATMHITVGEKLSSSLGCLVVVSLTPWGLKQSHSKEFRNQFFPPGRRDLFSALQHHLLSMISWKFSFKKYPVPARTLWWQPQSLMCSLSGRAQPWLFVFHYRVYCFQRGLSAEFENQPSVVSHPKMVGHLTMETPSWAATTLQIYENRQLPIWQHYNQHQSQ